MTVMTFKDDSPGLNADEIHTVAAADISPSDPVHLVSIAIIIIITITIINHLEVFGQLILPAEEIVVSIVLRVFDPVRTVLKQLIRFSILEGSSR